jgi:hypothetical protein
VIKEDSEGDVEVVDEVTNVMGLLGCASMKGSGFASLRYRTPTSLLVWGGGNRSERVYWGRRMFIVAT